MDTVIPPAPAIRPPVFIGSYSEGLTIAETLQVLLDRDCDTQLWPQDLFAPFALPDPDVAVIARKLKYDSALQVMTVVTE
jgi:hypothetical protein